MKKSHLQEINRTFYTDAVDIEAKKQVAMQFDTMVIGGTGVTVVLVNVTSHRYDVSNAFDVELHDEERGHYFGKLADLSYTLLNMRERGMVIASSGFTLLVKNPFEQDMRCPRLKLEFSFGGR